MAGGGSIQSMITSIKNNRNLLKKNRTFIKNKKDLFKMSGGELEFKKLSKIKLEILKAKIRKKARKESLKNNLSLAFLVLIMLTALIYFGDEEYRKGEIYKKAVIEKQKRYRFKNMIKSTDRYLGKIELNKSLKHYKSAKKLYPNDSIVNHRIKLVDSLINVGFLIDSK